MELFEALRNLAEAFEEAWIVVKKAVQPIIDAVSEVRKEIPRDDCIRSTWTINFDTRKVSQVLNRKPLFAIQKII